MKKNNALIQFHKNPFSLFESWFLEAKEHEINDPNAMNLATISDNLQPSSRIVLLKSFDESGFVFFTNTNSKKGKSILTNSYVALNFYWKSLHKQIRIEGIARKVTDQEADDYFETRHEQSKIGAWASSQSDELKSREELEQKLKKFSAEFEKKKIKRPLYWSGYRVEPNLFEFWKEMPFRIHDRIEYTKKNNEWHIRKLYP